MFSDFLRREPCANRTHGSDHVFSDEISRFQPLIFCHKFHTAMFCLKDIIIYNISFLFVGTLGAFLKTKLLVYSTSQDIGQ